MTPRLVCAVLLLIPTFLGCQPQAQPKGTSDAKQGVSDAPTPDAAAPSPDEAKQHVQKYIDQFLGGNASLKMELLGMWGAELNTVESLEIVRALQKYTPEGKPLNNVFTVVILAKGRNELRNSTIQHDIEHTVQFTDGKWKIWGTTL